MERTAKLFRNGSSQAVRLPKDEIGPVKLATRAQPRRARRRAG